MSVKTEISWTDSTWSPIRARVKADAHEIAILHGWNDLAEIVKAMTGHVGQHCEQISDGCKFCYSKSNQHRRLPHNGTGLPFDKRSRELVDIFLDEEVLQEPLKWKTPKKIFVENQSDLFGEWAEEGMLDDVFALMAMTPQHTYQVLTKRAERMQDYLSTQGRLMEIAERGTQLAFDAVSKWGRNDVPGMIWNRNSDPIIQWKTLPVWPLPNVWCGVSVENRNMLERIDFLKDTPTAIRFISFEPLLEDLGALNLSGIHWAIAGGESGHGARPCHIHWIRSILRECRRQNVACFIKQLGARPMQYLTAEQSLGNVGKDWRMILQDSKGGDPAEWDEDLRVQEFPEVGR